MSESTTRAAINIVNESVSSEYRVGINYNEDADENEILYTLDVNGNVRFSGPARLKKQIIIEDSGAEEIEIETPPTADTVVVNLNNESVGSNEEKRLVFKQYYANNSNPEIFRLPVINSQVNESASYDILTTKVPVGIAQGGTGATTETEALANLGITPTNFANIGITPEAIGAMPITGTTEYPTLTLSGNELDFENIKATTITIADEISAPYVDRARGQINFYDVITTTDTTTSETVTTNKILGSIRAYKTGTSTRNIGIRQAVLDTSGVPYTDNSGSTIYETFRLPSTVYTDTPPTINRFYDILTTKAPVSMSQGGTGVSATDLASLKSQLGIKSTQAEVSFSEVTTSRTATSFISTISQDPNGVITATLQSLPYASASAIGVVSTGAQEFSGVKTFNNLTTFNDSITVSSSMTVNSLITGKSNLDLYGNLQFKESVDSTTAALFLIYNKNTASTDHTLAALQYSYNSNNERTNYYENYSFPTPDVGLNANKSYNIWTSKDFTLSSFAPSGYMPPHIQRALTYSSSTVWDSEYINNLRYYTAGKVGMLFTNSTIYTSTSVTAGWYELASIPAGYAPIMTIYNRVLRSDGNYATIRITSSGSIQVYLQAISTAATTGPGFFINMTFPVNVT